MGPEHSRRNLACEQTRRIVRSVGLGDFVESDECHLVRKSNGGKPSWGVNRRIVPYILA